jgi:hypothetical protein
MLEKFQINFKNRLFTLFTSHFCTAMMSQVFILKLKITTTKVIKEKAYLVNMGSMLNITLTNWLTNYNNYERKKF